MRSTTSPTSPSTTRGRRRRATSTSSRRSRRIPTVQAGTYRLQGFKASGEAAVRRDAPRPRQWPRGSRRTGTSGWGWARRTGGVDAGGDADGLRVSTSPSMSVATTSAAESEFDAAGNMYIFFRGGGRAVRSSRQVARTGILSSDIEVGLRSIRPPATCSARALARGVYEIDQYGPDGELEEATGAGIIQRRQRISGLAGVGQGRPHAVLPLVDPVASQKAFCLRAGDSPAGGGCG